MKVVCCFLVVGRSSLFVCPSLVPPLLFGRSGACLIGVGDDVYGDSCDDVSNERVGYGVRFWR